MEITAITKRRNHLFELVFLDGQPLELDKKTVIDNGLFVGQDLSDAQIKSLKELSDYQRAFSRAVWYLEQGDLSRKALLQKLERAKFEEAAIEKALNRLTELSLINDEALAERLAERLIQDNISTKAALLKMTAKGIDFATAKAALEDIECDTESQIRAVIEKKYKNKLSDADSTRRVFAALQRLGFGYSDIRAVLKAYSEELEYSEENYGL